LQKKLLKLNVSDKRGKLKLLKLLKLNVPEKRRKPQRQIENSRKRKQNVLD